MPKDLVLYGADWCPDCVRVKRILEENKLTYVYKNVDDAKVLDEMMQLTGGVNEIPTLSIDGEIYRNPDNHKLLEALQITTDVKNTAVRDLIIIGAGPAALAAAVYTAREDIETVLLEKGIVGGLAAITDQIDNYPGFAEGITGMELADAMQAQAQRFGAKIELGEVLSLHDEGKVKRLETTDGDMLAKAVLIATGSEWKKLGIKGESEYYGRGVHNCATCDGAFYRDKRLVVVGSGNSAAQEALFLTRFASHIDILIRGDRWKASDVLIQEVAKNPKIEVHFDTTTDEIVGENNKVVAVKGTDLTINKAVSYQTDGVFVFIGLRPMTAFLQSSGVELDEFGFVKTAINLSTNVSGVFAAGDVRSGATMQIASATGEGASAALSIRHYLERV